MIQQWSVISKNKIVKIQYFQQNCFDKILKVQILRMIIHTISQKLQKWTSLQVYKPAFTLQLQRISEKNRQQLKNKCLIIKKVCLSYLSIVNSLMCQKNLIPTKSSIQFIHELQQLIYQGMSYQVYLIKIKLHMVMIRWFQLGIIGEIYQHGKNRIRVKMEVYVFRLKLFINEASNSYFGKMLAQDYYSNMDLLLLAILKHQYQLFFSLKRNHQIQYKQNLDFSIFLHEDEHQSIQQIQSFIDQLFNTLKSHIYGLSELLVLSEKKVYDIISAKLKILVQLFLIQAIMEFLHKLGLTGKSKSSNNIRRKAFCQGFNSQKDKDQLQKIKTLHNIGKRQDKVINKQNYNNRQTISNNLRKSSSNSINSSQNEQNELDYIQMFQNLKQQFFTQTLKIIWQKYQNIVKKVPHHIDSIQIFNKVKFIINQYKTEKTNKTSKNINVKMSSSNQNKFKIQKNNKISINIKPEELSKLQQEQIQNSQDQIVISEQQSSSSQKDSQSSQQQVSQYNRKPSKVIVTRYQQEKNRQIQDFKNFFLSTNQQMSIFDKKISTNKKNDNIKQNSIRSNSIRQDSIGQNNIRQDSIQQNSIKQVNIRQESIRQKSIRQKSIRQNSIGENSIKKLNIIQNKARKSQQFTLKYQKYRSQIKSNIELNLNHIKQKQYSNQNKTRKISIFNIQRHSLNKIKSYSLPHNFSQSNQSNPTISVSGFNKLDNPLRFQNTITIFNHAQSMASQKINLIKNPDFQCLKIQQQNQYQRLRRIKTHDMIISQNNAQQRAFPLRNNRAVTTQSNIFFNNKLAQIPTLSIFQSKSFFPIRPKKLLTLPNMKSEKYNVRSEKNNLKPEKNKVKPEKHNVKSEKHNMKQQKDNGNSSQKNGISLQNNVKIEQKSGKSEQINVKLLLIDVKTGQNHMRLTSKSINTASNFRQLKQAQSKEQQEQIKVPFVRKASKNTTIQQFFSPQQFQKNYNMANKSKYKHKQNKINQYKQYKQNKVTFQASLKSIYQNKSKLSIDK